MKIHTASYFEPENHTGKLYAISKTKPKGFESVESAEIFYPSWKMIFFWKSKLEQYSKGVLVEVDLAIAWEIYSRQYTALLEAKKLNIENWLIQQTADITFLCWEKSIAPIPSRHCHRNLLGAWIEANFKIKHCIDEKNQATKTTTEKTPGINLKISPTEDGFFNISYEFNGKEHDLGLWSPLGMQGLVAEVESPTYPDKWFTSRGLPSKEQIALLSQGCKIID